MDAATLYTILTLSSGQKRTETQKFPTVAICEKAAQKLRKQVSIKDAIFYCVKRKADSDERKKLEAAQAAQAAAKRRAMQQQQQGGGGQQGGAGPIGMPRDFYSGTTAPKQ